MTAEKKKIFKAEENGAIINKKIYFFVRTAMEHETMKQRIKENYDTLSSQEKKVAKFIIDNYQQSILLSSSELAQQSGVSNTARCV